MNAAMFPRVDPGFAAHVDQRTPTTFEHAMMSHPSLTLDAVAALAQELGPESISAERATKPLVTEETDFVSVDGESIADQVRQLAANDSWFTLLNIEKVPAYAALVDHVLDAVASSAGMRPESLRRRMGFVFASSPGSVTSAHFDIEHSLLLQLDGHRTLGFGRFADDEDRERQVRRYWAGESFGRLDTMPEQVAEHTLAPGKAVYIPPYTPHWITNGDSTSLSLTVSFFNRSNEDESLVQAFNHKARKLGLDPPPYGQRARSDRAKSGLMRVYGAAKRRVRSDVSSSR